jgi:hypothetical protein
MVSRIPAIRPSQLSALKVLDPLDQEDEQRENDDREAHVQQIVHRHSSGGIFRGIGLATEWCQAQPQALFGIAAG